MARTYQTPLTVASVGGQYLLQSQAQADLFADLLKANGITEDQASDAFPGLDGVEITDRLKSQQRSESFENRKGRPVSPNQRGLLDAYRLAALTQGKRRIVAQIDQVNDDITMDFNKMSGVLDNLTASSVVLPDRETLQDQIDADDSQAADDLFGGEKAK